MFKLVRSRGRMRLPAAWLVATSLSCASGQSSTPDVVPFPAGTYAFTADLPGKVKFGGALVVTLDTIVPRPTEGECRLPAGAPGRTSLVYECQLPGVDSLVLSFNRASPLRRSEWGVATTVRKTRSVCTQWHTWENGSRSCTRSTPEEYDEHSRVRGSLVITQVPPVAPRGRASRMRSREP